MAVLHEASDDPRQLLVGILLVKLAQPVGTLARDFLVPRDLDLALDLLDGHVEHVLELPVGLLELDAELDVHVGSDGRARDQREPK